MAKKMPKEAALLTEWLDRLGMRDWAVMLQSDVDPSDMSIQNALGCTSWEESTKSAVIQIVNPAKLEGLTREFDYEQILVHEILHLKTSLLSSREEEDTLSDRVLHQIVDDLARAMIDLKHKKRKAKHEVSDL